MIYYVCAFENREARDCAFESFRNDPAWKAAAAASQSTALSWIIPRAFS